MPVEVVKQVKAYAIIRTNDKDIEINNKEVTLGREAEDGVVQISKSKKVSRKAAKILFNEKKE